MRISNILLWSILLSLFACAGKKPQPPARLPPAAKADGRGPTHSEQEALSAPMSVAAGVSAFRALASRLAAAENDEATDLGKLLRAQGLEPQGSCATRGLLGLLKPDAIEPETGETLAPDALGMVVHFRDPDSPTCALSRAPCALSLVPAGKDQVRFRAAELYSVSPEGKLRASSTGLTAGAWLLEVEMNSILDCDQKLQEGEIEDEGDPGYGEVAGIHNERSGMVVLLFHRGRFHELHRYLAQHSQRSGFSGFLNAGAHDVLLVSDEARPNGPGRFLYRVSEEFKTVDVNSESDESKETVKTKFECFWIDLDEDALVPLAPEELTSLNRKSDHPGSDCGKSYTEDDDDEAIDKNLGGAAEE